MSSPEAPADAVERLRKLLRLAKSDNANEAAVAAAAAQRLMSRYAIDAALLDAEAASPDAGGVRGEATREVFGKHRIYTRDSSLPTWILSIGSAVAEASRLRCSIVSSRGFGAFDVYGPAPDAALARETMTWLVAEVERLADRDRSRGTGAGARYWSSWRLGCAQTIATRLAEAERLAVAERRLELAGPSAADYADAVKSGDGERLLALDAAKAAPRYALAVVESALAALDSRPERIAAWMKEEAGIKLRAGRARRGPSRGDGLRDGRAAGHSAALRGRA